MVQRYMGAVWVTIFARNVYMFQVYNQINFAILIVLIIVINYPDEGSHKIPKSVVLMVELVLNQFDYNFINN